MRKTDLTGMRGRSAARKRNFARSVVWTAKRSPRDDSDGFIENTRHRVYLSRFQRFTLCQIRQYSGQTFGEHSFAAARRAYHKHIMPARRRDLQSAFRRILSFYKLQILARCHLAAEYYIASHKRLPRLSVEERDCLAQAVYRIDFYAAYVFSLVSVGFWDYELFSAALARRDEYRHYTVYTLNFTRQRQFTQKYIIVNEFQRTFMLVDTGLFRCAKYAERYRKVEHRTFFFGVRRREVDCYLTRSEVVPAVLDRRANTLPRFFYSCIGQSDYVY